MIRREEILKYIRRDAERPATLKEIMSNLSVGEENQADLQVELDALEAQGKIVRTRKRRYGAPERMNLACGHLQGHPKGFGFVLVEDGADIYIPADKMNGAMHNDRVMVRLHTKISKARRSREGEVIRILKRANSEVIGTYSGSQRYGFVIAEEKRLSQDIFIPSQDNGGAQSGDLVVVEITRWPQQRRNPEGRVIEVLGNRKEVGVDVLAIIRKFALRTDFPTAVQKEAEALPLVVNPEEYSRRLDLRGLSVVTIDSEDAKDLDDGISIEKKDNGNYLLGVHIADVAHYVREGSELDKEARERGCSVYLVDRVIPMLPASLSNGICSLNAGEDRLALTAFIEVDPRGMVVNHELNESVIRVEKRLSYRLVDEILVHKDRETREEFSELLPNLEFMAELCQILKAGRRRRGAIDFNFKEKKVTVDDQGRPRDVRLVERGLADEIIEEFMLLTNEVIAQHVFWLNLPFIYRVHEDPEEDDVVDLREFLHNLGYSLPVSRKKLKPKAFQRVLDKARGKKEERLINEVVLRSLKRARYANQSLGHFGLAVEYYTHFTAPIRRYPDLVIHRLLKALLRGKMSPGWLEKKEKDMPVVSREASIRERIADEAEKESVDMKIVEFMLDKVGEVYPGVVSGVTPFGLFVELENGVEGLVHVSNMTDDYYQYVEKQLLLQGERTKKRYRIGDMVSVQVTKVNLTERNIDFELVGDTKDRFDKS